MKLFPIPTVAPLSPAEKIIANAAALGEALGVKDRDMARAALHLAIAYAETRGDPDGVLAALATIPSKGSKQ